MVCLILLVQTITNWSLWYSFLGDKCASYFIDVKGVGASSPYDGAYNVEFPNGGKYLVQSMWSATQQKCLLSERSGKAVSAPSLAAGKVSGIKPLYD